MATADPPLYRPTALERAFELARSGDCATIGEIRVILKAKGLSDRQLDGPFLVRQLRKLCVAAKAKAA